MQFNLQLVYTSRSTSVRPENFKGIEPTVGRVLIKSRINNNKNGLIGVLYFGDGCFFQCVEGEEATVLELLQKIKDDPRHSNIIVRSRKLKQERSFGSWEMKFVAIEAPLTKLLEARKYERFDHYQFDDQMNASVLNFLGAATDVNATSE